MDAILQELQKLYTTYSDNPILGTEIVIEDSPDITEKVIKRNQDDVKFVESEYNELEKIGNYMVDDGGMEKDGKKELIVSEELGLAIEKPKGKTTVEQLWRIINVNATS